MLHRMRLLVVSATLALVVPASAREQVPGVTSTKIKLGNTAPYSRDPRPPTARSRSRRSPISKW